METFDFKSVLFGVTKTLLFRFRLRGLLYLRNSQKKFGFQQNYNFVTENTDSIRMLIIKLS